MNFTKSIIIFLTLISTFNLFGQVDQKVEELNAILKESNLNKKYYEHLEVSDGNLIFTKIGFEYKLANSDKRILPAKLIDLKKTKIKALSSSNKESFKGSIEFKTIKKKKEIYSETLKGKYSNTFVYIKAKSKEDAENIKTLIEEIIKELS